MLLATNDKLRSALLSSGLEMSRASLDVRQNRDAFWSTTVAPAFNDTTYSVQFGFGNQISEVDFSNIPGHERSGEELKRQYNSIRSTFTQVYENWSRSGQNDPSNFGDFCAEKTDSDDLNVNGKKCLAMSSVLRCGTPFELNDVLDFTLRTVPTHVMIDSGEGATSLQDSRAARRNRKLDTAEELTESVTAFKDLLHNRQCSQQNEAKRSA